MRWMLLLAVVAAALGCGEPAHGQPLPGRRHDPAAFDRALRRLEGRRLELARALRRAPDDAARARVRAEARRTVVRAIVDEIAPAWMGTPWGLGSNSTARRPHEPGKTVGCGYFVAGVLENAGLRLDTRVRFAQAAALRIQRSLAPRAEDLHRFGSITPKELRRRVAALGDGLYVIGLNIHVGFVVVQGADVRFVHASYTGPQVVTDEPLEHAAAIAASQRAGYFVSAVFQDDRLVETWLRGAPVTLR
jgi:hypothetical protein